MAVAPGGQDVDDQPLALGQHWDLKLLLPLHGWIIISAFTQCPSLRAQGGKGAPGCCGGVDWDCRWTTALPLEELIEDVAFEAHVGDAPTLALVELCEGVPGLHEGVVLLAVQLGHRGALPPAAAH